MENEIKTEAAVEVQQPDEQQKPSMEERLAAYEEFEANLAKMLDADPRARQIFEALAGGGKNAEKLIQEYQALEEQYEKNMESTRSGLEEFLESNNMSEDEADAVLTAIIDMVSEGIMGNITPAMLMMALKAHRYEEAVAEAAEKGRIKGRNESIKEHLRSLSGENAITTLTAGAAPQPRVKDSIFTIARSAKNIKD